LLAVSGRSSSRGRPSCSEEQRHGRSQYARQLREYRTQRRENAAAELRAKGPEYEEAAILVSFAYETIGLLVFRGVTPFSIVEELTGGLAVLMWRKLERWQRDVRVESAENAWAEWFQWLVERLGTRAREKQRKPAYEAFSGWRPTS
jgi:hypothetical protein